MDVLKGLATVLTTDWVGKARNREAVAIILQRDAFNIQLTPQTLGYSQLVVLKIILQPEIQKASLFKNQETFTGRRKRAWHLFRNCWCSSFSASGLDLGINLHFAKFQMDIKVPGRTHQVTHTTWQFFIIQKQVTSLQFFQALCPLSLLHFSLKIFPESEK